MGRIGGERRGNMGWDGAENRGRIGVKEGGRGNRRGIWGGMGQRIEGE